jgi:site-specific recombinase XerD/ribosomal protein L40E
MGWYRKKIEKFLKDENLTAEMRKELNQFYSEYIRAKDLRENSARTYLETIHLFGVFLSKRHIASYKQADLKDVLAFGDSLKKNSQQTVAHRKMCLKLFYGWMGKSDISGKLMIKKEQTKPIEPTDCITEDEFLQLLRACKTQRDRTLLNLAFETGARISELLNIRIKDAVFADTGTYVNIEVSKTTPRRIWLFDSVSDLKLLMQQHPDQKPESYLFVSNGTGQMTYSTAKHILDRIVTRTKLKKRIHWHLMRHTRASVDAKKGMNTVMANKKMGWTPGSNMFSRYSHLSDEDIRDWDEKARGLKAAEKEQNPQEARKCFRCGTLNPWQLKLCGVCGMALSQDALDQYNETIRKAGELNELRFKKLEEKVGIV